MNEWIAASRASRVRMLLPRPVSRWSGKSQYQRGVEAGQAQRRGRLAGALLGEAERSSNASR